MDELRQEESTIVTPDEEKEISGNGKTRAHSACMEVSSVFLTLRRFMLILITEALYG